jgi:hypothetical protein
MPRRDIEFVVPLEITFQLGGAEATVRPANVGQCIRMLGVVAPLVEELATLPPGLFERLFGGGADAAQPQKPTDEDMAELMRLLAAHGDQAVQLVHEATGFGLERLNSLMPDEFIMLFSVVAEVNQDFFVRAAAVFERAAGGLKKLAASAPAGPTPGLPPSAA